MHRRDYKLRFELYAPFGVDAGKKPAYRLKHKYKNDYIISLIHKNHGGIYEIKEKGILFYMEQKDLNIFLKVLGGDNG